MLKSDFKLQHLIVSDSLNMAEQFDTSLNDLLFVNSFLNVASVMTQGAFMRYEAFYFEMYARKLRKYDQQMFGTAVL